MVKVTINAKENGPLIVETDGKRLCALCRCTASENKQIVMAHMQNLVLKQKHQKSKFVIKFTRHFFLFSVYLCPFLSSIWVLLLIKSDGEKGNDKRKILYML